MTVAWDEAVDRPGLPQLAGDTTTDACVVGLGASGLAAVAELADRGLSVVGVDAGRVAAGAAGRNGGFLLGGGAPFLHEAIARWGQDVAVDLYRATLGELARMPDELVRRIGSLRLASDEGELTDCARHAAALREHGFAVEEYDGELGRGLFLPDDAAMNPVRRAMAMAGTLAGRASLYEHTRVSAVDAARVVTDRGVISAGAVIVAVDGRFEVLLPELAGRVRTARLQMLATAPVPARLPCPVYCRWGYDYAQQLADGRMFVGGGRDRFAEDEWTLEATPTAPVQAWIEQVAHGLAGRPVGVTHRWAASVGYTPDGRPLCVEVRPHVAACGGYSGTGNLVGPLTARAAVALALDGTPPPAWCAGSARQVDRTPVR
ncbi:MAG TPA: FAD-binding oxidoreductase [Jatrophihabitantaceae bacterium]